MKKIIINQCYGGFGFSKPFIKAFTQVKPLKNPEKDYFNSQDYRRDLSAIQLLEEHGTEWSSGQYARLVVKNVPLDIFQYVDVGEYDGYESLVIDWEKVSKRMVGIEIHSKRKALYQAIQAYLNSDLYK